MTQEQKMELIDNLDTYRIGLDDTFAFKCRICSRCCRNRDDILLNPRDVYNLATALNLTHKQVIEKYCEAYIGNSSNLPIVRLKPKGQNKVCPLLVGDRCSVHSLKPVICASFPLGRVIMTDNQRDEGEAEDENTSCSTPSLTPNKIEYIKMPTDCASAKRKQTVRSWLEMFGIPIEDKFFIKWNETIFNLSKAMNKYVGYVCEDGTENRESKEGVTAKAVGMLWDAIYESFYTAYDTQEEFYPQFEDNVGKITRLFDTLEQALPTIGAN